MVSHYDFAPRFTEAYHCAEEAYRRDPASTLSAIATKSGAWLAANGLTNQALYDYVDDDARYGEPGIHRALMIESVRRDYFLNVQEARTSATFLDVDAMPPKDAEVDGIAWLPRLITKARAKLRGELPPSLMYGCGGDRAFLQDYDLDPAEFLSAVWRHDAQPAAIAAWIHSRTKRRGS
jgi:hypothetical protein